MVEKAAMNQQPKHNFPIVAIGASAGGLEAFTELVADLPERLHAAVIFVQHLPPERKSLLPDLLRNKRPDLHFSEPEEDTSLEPGHIYLGPPGKALTLDKCMLRINPETKRHPPHIIDNLLISLARAVGDRAVGVILSGAGSDGARGASEIRALGGSMIVQDPATAQFPSMPRAVIAAGAADMVINPAAIARTIDNIVDTHQEVEKIDELTTPENMKSFFDMLYKTTGFRFQEYKQSVFERRVRRRMQLRGLTSVHEYIQEIEHKPDEARQLAGDFLIGVTSFFRDPDAWQELKAHVVRSLILEKKDEPIRVWTPACSTGEESYSIAIMLHDELDRAGKEKYFQIFASDINDGALEKARKGVYPGCFEGDIPLEYWPKYFTSSEDRQTMEVNTEIREKIVFARHDVLEDPPFSKQDLIICRNLLIYLDPRGQERCIDIFNYALGENRYLFLGKAEGVSGKYAQFQKLEPKEANIFKRLPGVAPSRFPTTIRRTTATQQQKPEPQPMPPNAAVVNAARNVLLAAYTPAAVAIDKDYTVLFNNGPVNRYLTPPFGEPTRNLLEQLPKRLATRIRSAVYRVSQDGEPVVLRATIDKRKLSVTVSKLEESDSHFLVVFEEKKGRMAAEQKAIAETPSGDDSTMRQLEDELTATRLDLQQHIEQLRNVNEKLQSYNEELTVSNEELETSREELQSLNEELITVNAQLQSKITEQEETNNDLVNFQTSTNLPALFLDHQLRVRRFTPAMTGLVSLIPGDIGRPLADLSQKKLGPDLELDARTVLDTLEIAPREIAVGDAWYIRSTQPYRTADDRVNGVVMTWSDVTSLKRAQKDLREAAEKFRIVADFTYDWEYWRGTDDRFIYMTPSCEIVTGYSREEFMEDPDLYTRIIHPDDREMMVNHLADNMKQRKQEEFEFRIVRRDGTMRWIGHKCRPVIGDNGQMMGRRSVNRDITRQKEAEQERELLIVQQQAIMESMNDALVIAGPTGEIIYHNPVSLSLHGYSSQEASHITGKTASTLWKNYDLDGNELPFEQWPMPRALRSERFSGYEVRVKSVETGKEFIGSYSGSPVFDVHGNLFAALLTIRDITGHKEIELDLQRSRRDLNRAQEVAQVGSWRMDTRNNELFWSDEAYRIFGVPKGTKLSYEDFLSFVHPDQRETVDHTWNAALKGEPYDIEHQIVVDGTIKWVHEIADFEFDKNGELTGGFGTVQDITNLKKTELALRGERELLDTIFDSIPVMITLYEPTLKILTLNRQVYETTGWTEEDLKQKSIMELVYPDPHYRKEVADYMQSLQPGFKDIVMTRKDGNTVETSWANVRIPDGRQVGIGLDISERKQNEREREELFKKAEKGKVILEALLAHVPEGIVITGGIGESVTISRTLHQWTGERMRDGIAFGSDEFVEAWGLVDPENKEPIDAEQLPIMRVFREGRPVVNDVWLQKGPDGSWRYVSANAGPILDREGKVKGCVVAWRDITDMRKNEEALKRRTSELVATNEELESFSYSVSHDLRNPLNNIQIMTEMLEECSDEALDDDGKKALEHIEKNVDRMTNIIADLLELSRISRHELQIQYTDLSAMAGDFIDELKRTNPEREIDIVIHDSMSTRADRRLMQLALENLIRNAWKYTAKCEHPRIEIGVKQDSDSPVFFVKDNGAGFDMSNAKRIFTPFQRAHSEKEYKGTGIGLSIVKRIIHKHGGEIWAESEIGKGSCFYFTVE
ncbi:MAG: PAS domain S-box protein [Chitinivibrionales bacterium]|nr:PAS domain S-box protein [Chitinivibrionales bacterium]